MQLRGARLLECSLHHRRVATVTIDRDLDSAGKLGAAVLGYAGMPAFDVGTGDLGAGAVRLAGCLDENIGAGDAMLLDQMLDRDLRITPRGKTADDGLL